MTREHHLIVVLWGRQYRHWFTDHCLPSLMTTNNLPAADARAEIVVACPAEDWGMVSGLYTWPYRLVHIPFEAPDADVLTERVNHATKAHAILMQRAYDAKAIVTILTPDVIVSDGSMAWARQQIREGKHLALAPAMRFASEPLLSTYLSNDPRNLVAAALPSMHSEGIRMEWSFPSVPITNYAFWWRAPDGMVVNSVSWAPVMADTAVIKRFSNHHLLKGNPIDASYVWSNWGDPGPDYVSVADDSDKAFWCSFGPVDEHANDLKPHGFYDDPKVGELVKGAALNAVFRHGYDPLKQRLFFTQCRWHAKDMDERWAEVEREARLTLRRFISPKSAA